MPDEVQRICNQRQFIDLIRLQCFAESVRLGAEKNLYVMGAFWMELWAAEDYIGNEYDVAFQHCVTQERHSLSAFEVCECHLLKLCSVV